MQHLPSLDISHQPKVRATKAFQTNQAPSPQDPYANSYRLKSASSLSNQDFREKTRGLMKNGQTNSRMIKHISSVYFDSVPVNPKQSQSSVLAEDKFAEHINFEKIFDQFLISAQSHPLYQCVESLMKLVLGAFDAVLWEDIPSLHILYSRRLGKSNTHSSGLIGKSFVSRSLVTLDEPMKDPSFSAEDDDIVASNPSPVALFPLFDSVGNVSDIVEIMRGDTFPDIGREVSFIRYFSSKFSAFHSIIVKLPSDNQFIYEILQSMEIGQFLLIFQRKMDALFRVRAAEIWQYNQMSKETIAYRDKPSVVDSDATGIAGESLTRVVLINTMQSRMISSFCESADGAVDEAVLAVPFYDSLHSIVYSVVLRGGQNKVFLQSDEMLLSSLIPYISLALSNIQRSTSTERIQKSRSDEILSLFSRMLFSLRGSDESKSAIGAIIETSMNAVQTIIDADRSSIAFLNSDQIFEDFTSTTSIPSLIQLAKSSKQIINASNLSSKLLSTADLFDDYRLKNGIIIPVIKAGEVIGVAQFLNKKDGSPFTDNDCLDAECVVDLISLIYSSINIRRQVSQVRGIPDFSMADGDLIRSIISSTIQKVRTASQLDHLSIYVPDLNGFWLLFSDGFQLPFSIDSDVLTATIKSKEQSTFSASVGRKELGRIPLKHLDKLLQFGLSIPILSNDSAIAVILALRYKQSQDSTDQLSSFANIITTLLSGRAPDSLSMRGNPTFSAKYLLKEDEDSQFSIPSALLPQKKGQTFLSAFSVMDCNENELMGALYSVLDGMNIMKAFQLKAGALYRFAYAVRERLMKKRKWYWRSVVNCFQFVGYCLTIDALCGKFSEVEIFSLFLSVLIQKFTKNPLRMLEKVDNGKVLEGISEEKAFDVNQTVIAILNSVQGRSIYDRAHLLNTTGDRIQFLAFLIHLGNVSIFCRPYSVGEKYISECGKPDSSFAIGFINLLTIPAINSAIEVIPGIECCKEVILSNLERWKEESS